MKKFLLNFTIIILFLSSCGGIVEVRPRKMHASIINEKTGYSVKDSGVVNYYDTQIYLWFDSLITYGDDVVSRPVFSLVGRISAINVIAHYIDGNNIIKDTINDKMTFRINYDIDKYKNLQDVEGKVPDIPKIRPYANNSIVLSFSAPPDTTKLQYFVVEYVESDGLKLVDTTQKVYIK